MLRSIFTLYLHARNLTVPRRHPKPIFRTGIRLCPLDGNKSHAREQTSRGTASHVGLYRRQHEPHETGSYTNTRIHESDTRQREIVNNRGPDRPPAPFLYPVCVTLGPGFATHLGMPPLGLDRVAWPMFGFPRWVSCPVPAGPAERTGPEWWNAAEGPPHARAFPCDGIRIEFESCRREFMLISARNGS